MSVRDLNRAELEELSKDLISYAMIKLGREVGVTVFVFDFGPAGVGDIAYISNSDREGMIRAVEIWIEQQRAGLTTDPKGERPRG